jgi:hypothetical protein
MILSMSPKPPSLSPSSLAMVSPVAMSMKSGFCHFTDHSALNCNKHASELKWLNDFVNVTKAPKFAPSSLAMVSPVAMSMKLKFQLWGIHKCHVQG